MIYTSYFNSGKEIEGYRKVSIALSTPAWFECEKYEPLNPTWEMISLAKAGKFDEYISEYVGSKLSILNPYLVYQELNNSVIYCYESSPSKGFDYATYYLNNSKLFCHRHLIAMWFGLVGLKCIEL